MLPAIGHKIIERPGYVPATHFIPDHDAAFWNDIYSRIANDLHFAEPVENSSELINPYFGRYGFRWHPVAAIPRYFHIGVDIHSATGTPIKVIDDGLLQYSGYAPINGIYIVISHPHIATEDGYVLNSIYMHCESVSHRFNILQKVCRKYISTKPKWVNIPVKKADVIATVGDTGIKDGYAPHLHLQLDFVSSDGLKRVSVDPAIVLNLNLSPNLTSEILSINEFRDFYKIRMNGLSLWSKFIESYI